ncbi:MAG TPA: A24 family peptidase [Nitriliruptoraceae bacterium]|nr:A24 family peptidase [Nitriliruptoraceae bacterium]
MTAWTWAAVAVMAVVSAHLATTAVVRWSRDQAVRTPPHPCCVGPEPHPVAWSRVVPLASWLQHRGRCPTCAATIPRTLLAVEVASIGVLVAGVAVHPGLQLLLVLPVLWSAVVATPIDLAHRIIPNRLTHPLALWSLAVVTVLAATSGQWSQWRLAMVAGFGLAGGLLAVSLVYELLRGQPGIGMGDIKWGLPIGITVGWLGIGSVLVWLYATVAVSLVVMVGLVVTGRARIASRVPYGPYLAFGVVVGILFAQPVLDLLYG